MFYFLSQVLLLFLDSLASKIPIEVDVLLKNWIEYPRVTGLGLDRRDTAAAVFNLGQVEHE